MKGSGKKLCNIRVWPKAAGGASWLVVASHFNLQLIKCQTALYLHLHRHRHCDTIEGPSFVFVQRSSTFAKFCLVLQSPSELAARGQGSEPSCIQSDTWTLRKRSRSSYNIPVESSMHLLTIGLC
ncbi:unnamed protein product [Peniophora sp. CBMAI 1063]|nr:unnamed protein product [Peniophora sp. CBMAI 1063]